MDALRKLIRAIARWVLGRPRAGSDARPTGAAGFEDFFGSTKDGHDDH